MKRWHSFPLKKTLFVAPFVALLFFTIFLASIPQLAAQGPAPLGLLLSPTTAQPLLSDSNSNVDTHRQSLPIVGQIQDATSLRLFSAEDLDDLTSLNQGVLDEPLIPTEYALTLRTAVGLDKSTCAEQPVLNIRAGTKVVYCYFVINIGTEDINFHTVEDSLWGEVRTNASHSLVAGSPALITKTVSVTETSVSTGTWIGLDSAGTPLATASAPAKVYVNGITVAPGVGFLSDACPEANELPAMVGTEVERCYRLVNGSDLLLTNHRLTDSQSGIVADNLSFPLAPGESFNTKQLGLNLSTIVTQTSRYSLTWESSTLDWPPEIPQVGSVTPITLTATAAAAALVPELAAQLTVRLEPGDCPGTKELTVFAGTNVIFCYEAHNIGPVPFTYHTVSDDHPPIDSESIAQHVIVNNTYRELPPGDVGQIIISQKVYTSTTVTMLWEAFSSNPLSTTLFSEAISKTNDALRSLNTAQLPGPVVSAQAQSQVTITILPLADINIIVYEDLNQDGGQDSDEVGIPNATALLTESNNRSQTFTIRTDSEGVARFTQLPLALYDIEISFEEPFQNFEPVDRSVISRGLQGGPNEDIALGFRRIGNPPERIYLPAVMKGEVP